MIRTTPPMTPALPAARPALSALSALTKGHGTENDFVIVPDVAGELEISAAEVAKLCDRRAGIGADGLLRVVRTAKMPGYEDEAPQAEFFMDYRNADGSVAEICGNGVRVFALYLVARELVKVEPTARAASEFGVATRGGVKQVRLVRTGENTAEVTVDMGIPVFPQSRGSITVDVLGAPRPAVDVDMGNPHAVVFVDSVDEAGDLFTMPRVAPEGVYADGVNVEFVEDKGPRHIAMRVFERGVGETRSCGTGACAAMIATARRDNAPAGADYTVDVPGGRLQLVERADGHLEMTGPAVLVFEVVPLSEVRSATLPADPGER
jgi:diaminopimelate epimerase